MKTLVLGATGLLGPYLAGAAACLGDVVRHGQHSGDKLCNLRDPKATAKLLEIVAPDLVFNCVALTNVDRCEDDPEAADLLNRQVVQHVVNGLSSNAILVQISTDQVYSGVRAPTSENCTDPVNVYGKSKLAGEYEALRHSNAVVLRVNLFGPTLTSGRSSLSDWMLQQFRSRAAMTLFSDNLFSPLHMDTLAATAMDIVRAGLRGTYNVGSRAGMSKAEFGLALARQYDLSASQVEISASSAMPGRAPRPLDMRMDVSKIEQALGRSMPTLLDQIALLKDTPTGATQ